MPTTLIPSLSRWDQHGREHVVRAHRAGIRRTLRCGTCGWRKAARFLPYLPWLKAESHLMEAHQATVDPAAGRA
ncbi:MULTISPECIES: hypothetical protein [Streptomyces]|uniref:Transposase n=1 Tax=Streptomyces chengmaiensis TaxID=3040919 RepID=A0ABT6HTX3_9ACTN|nr:MULTISPECIES: hypothetical protein [Streptomyces]MDH2391309.1 hypothetical protein [Streptomyces chengmaiensis]WRQ79342.1 hypothetical protein I3F59_008155 [Streptomyces sp. MUM 178J]